MKYYEGEKYVNSLCTNVVVGAFRALTSLINWLERHQWINDVVSVTLSMATGAIVIRIAAQCSVAIGTSSTTRFTKPSWTQCPSALAAYRRFSVVFGCIVTRWIGIGVWLRKECYFRVNFRL